MIDGTSQPKLKVLVFAASLRAESLNRKLAALAARVAQEYGASVDLVLQWSPARGAFLASTLTAAAAVFAGRKNRVQKRGPVHHAVRRHREEISNSREHTLLAEEFSGFIPVRD